MRIKNVQTALSLFFILIFSLPVAQAAEVETNTNNQKTGTQVPKYSSRRRTYSGGSGFFGYHQSGYQIISGSMTSGLEYGQFAGLQGTFDYQYSKKFSLGAQLNLFFNQSDISTDRTIGAFVRGNYHFLDRGRTQKIPLDFYTGITLGNIIGRHGWVKTEEDREVELSWGVHMGLRYKIADSWLLYGEIGKQSSCLGVGFMF